MCGGAKLMDYAHAHGVHRFYLRGKLVCDNGKISNNHKEINTNFVLYYAQFFMRVYVLVLYFTMYALPEHAAATIV